MTISLITVTYNSGNTLFSTLQSVLSQTHLDIEYIIVDGVSKDHTIDVLKEYEPKFNGRLRWISEPDKGLYDAMNKGIRMATGDVVGILNSDDFFTGKDVLAQVVRAFETDDRLAAVYGDVHFVHPDKLDKCVRYYSSKVFKRKLMRFGFMPAHPSFYLRRKYFGKVLVADPSSLKRSNQEWELFLILEEAKKRVGAGGPFWAIYCEKSF